MAFSNARITGRVLLRSGTPAFGCRVSLIVEGGAPIAETFTSSRGAFVLDIPAARLPSGEGIEGGFELGIIDGTGSVLVHAKNITAYAGLTAHHELQSDTAAMLTLPMALPLDREEGTTFLREEGLAVIDAAMGRLAPTGSAEHARYLRAFRRTLPPSGHVEELIELSWAALDGDPDAMGDLRDVLAVQAASVRRAVPASTVPPPEIVSEESQRKEWSYGRVKQKEDPDHALRRSGMTTTARLLLSALAPGFDPEARRRGSDDGVIATDRLLPLLVAAVRASRTAEERALFFDGMDGILRGLVLAEHMHRAARAALQTGRLAPLRALLALILSAEEGDDVSRSSLVPMAGESASPGSDPTMPDLLDPWWTQLQAAVHETEAALQRGRSRGATYRIETIDPPHALPGQRVVLSGEGFGAEGEIVFTGAAPVAAEAWTDTRIEAVVPHDARPGPVALRVLGGVVKVHKRLVELYREGRGSPFSGGRPRIRELTLGGRPSGWWLRPGSSAPLAWTSDLGPDARITLTVHCEGPDHGGDDGVLLFEDDELPATGSILVRAPAVSRTHRLVARMRASTPAGPVRREARFPVAIPPRLEVLSVEVTQGVQAAPGEEPSATVAGRDTFVRVHLTSERGGFEDDRTAEVDGRLHVGDHVLSPLNGTRPDAPAPPTPIDVGPARTHDPRRTDHALLFRIPADACHGTRELRITLTSPSLPPDDDRVEARVGWTWRTPAPRSFRWVRATTGGNDTPESSHDQARATLVRALDGMPVVPDDVGPAWSRSWSSRLEPQGDDDPGWTALLDELVDLRDPAAWEWLHDDLDEATRRADPSWWVAVLPGAPEGMVDPGARVAVVPPLDLDDPDTRRRGVQALARALAGDAATEEGDESVAFDPWWTHTVDDLHRADDGDADARDAWVPLAAWRRALEAP